MPRLAELLVRTTDIGRRRMVLFRPLANLLVGAAEIGRGRVLADLDNAAADRPGASEQN